MKKKSIFNADKKWLTMNSCWDVANVVSHVLFSSGWGSGNTEPNW